MYCNLDIKDINKRFIGVIGLGRSGIAAANLASLLGARVLASEIKNSGYIKSIINRRLNKNVIVEYGMHTDKLLSCDLIIKSPGIENNLDIIKKIKKLNIPIISELEFAFHFIKPQKIIAITGTNGKTTTTTLIGEILKNAKIKNIVCGNIGFPLSSFVSSIDKETVIVLEVSSYQLEDCYHFKPDISIVLNITPDHLKYHGSMTKYIEAKKNILKNQSQNNFCILNYDDNIVKRFSKISSAPIIFFSKSHKLKNGLWYQNGYINIKLPFIDTNVPIDLKIPGEHNIENALAAFASAICLNINTSIIQNTLSKFKGVEHRIELVDEVNQVKYYNDSKATNIDSTLVALKSFDKNIWLILGGQHKGTPYHPLKPLIQEKVKGIFTIGESANIIKNDLDGIIPIYDCKTLENAVFCANKKAKPNDIVLLSPACASFDQFKNFEERGKIFKRLVKRLKKYEKKGLL